MNDEGFMARCYELAQQAVDNGNHPFGAILVVDGEIVLEALNTAVTESDNTRHAELNLVRAASKHLTPEEISNAVLYTSTEPCPMCTGAIYWSGVTKIVFGVSGADLGEIAGESFVWSSAELLDRANNSIEVIGPVSAIIGRKLHQSFWVK